MGRLKIPSECKGEDKIPSLNGIQILETSKRTTT